MLNSLLTNTDAEANWLRKHTEPKTPSARAKPEYFPKSNPSSPRLAELARALEEPIAPVLTFTGYDGTGTAYTAMVMLDYTMLELTELPFVIHDTPVWANVSKPRQERIVKYLQGHRKQLFFALDNLGALPPGAHEIVDTHTVISLNAGDESLLGYITTLLADERPTFGIPAEQLPA